MFKRTRSLSNALCFKHNNNVCACAVSALILLLVINLSPEMDLATPMGNFSRPTLLFAQFGDFSLCMLSFDDTTTSGLKYDVIFEFIAPVFL